MNSSPHSPFRSLARRLAVAGGVLAVGAALAPSAAAWGPREDAPVLESSIIQPGSGLTLREDGSAVYLARGLDVASNDVNQLVARPPGGPAAFASPFPSGFGQYVSSNSLYLSPMDAAGNLLVYRTPDPKGLAFLAPGADPAGAAIEPLANQITEIDLAPSGEAAAIVSLGSTAGVSFRAAGPGRTFDAPRMLDRMGAMRSYGLGITLDSDGGVFVVYRTEQDTGILQTYAPPGGDFGPAVQLDAPATINDVPHFHYAQSTNGHGLLVWSENVADNSNRDEVWAATREPGGLLGPKSLVAEKAAADWLVDVSSAGITDDGSQYVGIFDADPVSGCPGNADLDRGGAIAQRSGNGPWDLTEEVGAWPNTSTIGAIATAGNTVGVIVQKDDDTGPRCESTEGSSRLEVRLGQGGSLGGSTTIASESGSGSVGVDGFAVNAGGSAILLSDEPSGPGDWKRFIYFHQPGDVRQGGPGSGGGGGGPVPSAKPLPAPGKIVLSGRKLVSRDGEVPFEASCARLGPGDKVYCRVEAILLEQVKRETGRGSAAAKQKGKPKQGKAKKGKPKPPKVLARGKQVTVPAGKTKTVKLKLNKLGGKKLKRGGGRTPATLRVTIRKGANTATIERKVTLEAGKSKKPGKGKAKGKRK
jgi:hypothetical protein